MTEMTKIEKLRAQHRALTEERREAHRKVGEARDADDRDAAKAAEADLDRIDALRVKIARRIGELEFEAGETVFVACHFTAQPPYGSHPPSKYNRIAIVETAKSWEPTMIRDTKRTRVVSDWGKHYVGVTENCAFAINWKRAEAAAAELNAKRKAA